MEYYLEGGKSLPKHMSLDEEVLLAAAYCDSNSQHTFTAEELAIEAWRKFPDSFSMEGHAEYPDSNRVYTKLMGKKGLVGRGWLVKVSEKRYQLSEAGRITAKALGDPAVSSIGLRAVLSRDQKRILEKLFSSRVFLKLKGGQSEDIGFHDACSFWDISPRSNASILRARLTTVEAIIDIAEKAISEQGELSLIQGGSIIGTSEIELLKRAHYTTLNKFQNDLDVIRKRQDERRYH
jgi:hypothetical protein